MKRIVVIVFLSMFVFTGTVWGWQYTSNADQSLSTYAIVFSSESGKDVLSMSFRNGMVEVEYTDINEAGKRFFDYLQTLNPNVDDNIIDLLTRCREFVRDRDKSSWPGTVQSDLLYRPPPTAIQLQERVVEETQGKLERMKRETQLRHDIDEILKNLEAK